MKRIHKCMPQKSKMVHTNVRVYTWLISYAVECMTILVWHTMHLRPQAVNLLPKAMLAQVHMPHTVHTRLHILGMHVLTWGWRRALRRA